ncbi:hypothetical protein GQX74_013167 [Glossina fuscipes]|nr:hypothetical protein GQX74_013167 [Glossina fuscipes]
MHVLMHVDDVSVTTACHTSNSVLPYPLVFGGLRDHNNNRKYKYLYNCNKSSSATDNSKDYVFAKSQFDELAALYQSMGKWRVLINIAFRYLGHILSQDFSNKSAVKVDPEKNWSASGESCTKSSDVRIISWENVTTYSYNFEM